MLWRRAWQEPSPFRGEGVGDALRAPSLSPEGERGSGSPDAHALLGRQVQLVALLDPERIVPRVEVAHRQRAEVPRRMAVGGDALAQLRLAVLARPGLGVGDEEALVA